tara:strand:- start:26 stop:433 length:408 start_codon:yes stop_codon:yes gene_type:complete
MFATASQLQKDKTKTKTSQKTQVSDKEIETKMVYYMSYKEMLKQERPPHQIANFVSIDELPPKPKDFGKVIYQKWLASKQENSTEQPVLDKCLGTWTGTAWNCSHKPADGCFNCKNCQIEQRRWMMDKINPAMEY